MQIMSRGQIRIGDVKVVRSTRVHDRGISLNVMVIAFHFVRAAQRSSIQSFAKVVSMTTEM